MKLLETIKYQNGQFYNLEFHEERMRIARKSIFGLVDPVNLKSLLQSFQQTDSKNIFKCRIVYDIKIDSVEFIEYNKPSISRLKVVEDNEIEYNHKFLNRKDIDELFQTRQSADDIIIIKNKFVSDSSYANLLFYNGSRWLTPSRPLLMGTQRASLLSENKITTADIHISHIESFKKVRLINAMISFEDELDINISDIIH